MSNCKNERWEERGKGRTDIMGDRKENRKEEEKEICFFFLFLFSF